MSREHRYRRSPPTEEAAQGMDPGEDRQFGDRALNGEWEEIPAQVFEIMEEMTLHFEGTSCNIVNEDRELVESLTDKSGLVEREIPPGYRCYVIKARVMFERKQPESPELS